MRKLSIWISLLLVVCLLSGSAVFALESVPQEKPAKEANASEATTDQGGENAPTKKAPTREKNLFLSLKSEIDGAGSGPKTIELEAGDYFFTETLNLNNKNITLVNKGNVTFKRADGFTDTMISVDKDSSLTLQSDGNFVFDGEKKQTHLRKHGSFVYTEGKLTIDGSRFINDYDHDQSQISPIFASGDKAKVLFRSGEVSGTDYAATSGSDNWYSAGAFFLQDGAEMTMDGGVIKNNKVSWFKHPSWIGAWSNTSSAGGVMVHTGGHFTMNGGTIEGNLSDVGGVHVGTYDIYDINRWESDPAKLKKLAMSTFTMNGGTIRKNNGTNRSGGVNVFANAKMEMNGGEISENKGYGGGGLLVMDWYVDGVQGVNQTRAKAPFNEWTKLYPAAFTMNGGKITKNVAYSCGGGIDIASDHVKLVRGEISDNQAGDQGGGVYVTATPYALHVENAYIAENEATKDKWVHSGMVNEGGVLYKLTEGAGGGTWFCPTGDAKFYAENGAVFDRNTADVAGDDFHSEDKVAGTYFATLPKRLKNGAKVEWYKDAEGKRYADGHREKLEDVSNIVKATSLKAVANDEAVLAAKKRSGLLVERNSANKGGGFGSNGTIIFGKAPNEENKLKKVKILKTWKDVEPKEIEVALKIRLADKTELTIDRVKLNKENGFKAEISDLPAVVEGKAIEDLLFVEELNSKDYQVEISPIRKSGTEDEFDVFTVEIKNGKKPTVNKIVKKVKTGDREDLYRNMMLLLLACGVLAAAAFRKARKAR